MSSLNKGLSEYVNPTSQVAPTIKKSHGTFLGHVLEVVTDKDSDLYDGIESIGLIRVNIIPANYDKPESDARAYAYPMDRGNYVLPLAGQQVWGVIALAPDTTQRYYYGGVVSTEQTAAAVVVPFLGAAPSALKQDGYPTPDVAAKRFDEKNGYKRESLLEKTSQEKFREGDKIIEGQFGGVIKFTHTISKQGVWNNAAQITNVNNPTQLASRDGDPMLIIKADLRSPGFIYEDDDINVDKSSVYLATSQNVPIKLSCSNRLLSYDYVPTIIPELKTTIDEESTSLAKFFGGGFDPNAKINVKLEGTIEYNGSGATPGGGGESTSVGNVLIGDSQTPTVARFAKKAKLIDPEGKGEKPEFLQKTGWSLKQLDAELINFTPSPDVKNIIVCIGTNDGYAISVEPQTFLTHLKTAFPSATGFYMVQGSWGWGDYLVAAKKPEYGNVQKPSFFVTYYQKFQAVGFTLIEPPIGYWDAGHPGPSTPSFKLIGAAIDSALG